MEALVTAFTLFSIRITWLHLLIGCGAILLVCIILGAAREKKKKISLGTALRDTLRVTGNGRAAMMKFYLAEILIILICLAPLLMMFEMPAPVPAAIAAALWFLLYNPARVCAADAMQASLEGESIFSLRLADGSRWGSSVWRGLVRTVQLALWAVPMAYGVYFAYRLYKGTDDIDGITVLQAIQDFGGGDVKRAILYIFLIVAGLILILMIGAACHSGARHALVLGNPRMVNGHRWKLVLGWLWATLLFMLPFWIALAAVLIQVLPILLSDLNGIIMHTASLPRSKNMLLTLAVGGLLTVPLMPLRSLMVAAMVHQLKDGGEKAAA